MMMRLITDRWRAGRAPAPVPVGPEHFPDAFHVTPAVSPGKRGVSAGQESVAPGGKCGLGDVENVGGASRAHAVFWVLLRAEGPLTMGELARRMQCSSAECTRRVKMSAAKLRREKRGRYVLISLAR